MSVTRPSTAPHLTRSGGPPRQPPSVGSGRGTRGRRLIVAVVLGLLLAAVTGLVFTDQMRRSAETTAAIDGEVGRVGIESTGGDLPVGVADGTPQVTVTEHRPPGARATPSSSLEDGVLRVSNDCSGGLLTCLVDHNVEVPAGVGVEGRATAGDVRLVGIGDVGGTVDEDADAPRSLVARTETGSTSIRPAGALDLAPATATGVPAEAQGGPSPLDTPQALETFLDGVMVDHFDRFVLAGASITVVKDGELWVSKGYGHADVATGTPVEADTTIFPTASVSKLFTWTAIMQLVEQGTLDLDAEVNRYLAAFQVPDGFDEPVRVRHLLSHTAGFEDKPMSVAVDPEDLIDLETALIDDMPSQDWEPGRYTAYSNYSTGLAGYLVAEVSGMSWQDYIDHNILQPLDMTHTSTRQPTPDNLEPGMTKVYATYDGELTEAGYEIVSLAPFGGMVASTEDMANFMLAHLQHGRFGETHILREATARQMHSQLFTHDPRLAGNAHGFWESTENGQRILSHGGDHNTSMTWLWLLPEHDLGVYVAYNSDGGTEARAELWEAFLKQAFPTEVPTPAEPPATQEDLGRFTGTYSANRISSTTPAKLFKLLAVMTISADDGHLTTHLAGYGSQRWVATGENAFTAVDGRTQMVFSADSEQPSHVFFDGSPMTAYSPLGAWVAVPWYDRAALHGGLLTVSLLLILSALTGWPVLSIVRRRTKSTRPTSASAGVARWWAAATGGLYLLFVVLLVVALFDFIALEYGASPVLVAALTVGIAAAVLTAGTFIHMIRAWRDRYWSLAGRVHYTFVTLALVSLAWQLHHWNLLGLHT